MALDLTKSTPKKHTKDCVKLLQCPVHEFGMGRGHARMTITTGVLMGTFAAAFVFFLTRGVILVPGILLLAFAVRSIQPQRGLAVTDYEVVLVKVSGFNGRPNGILGRQPHALVATYPAGKVELTFGEERMRMPAKEFGRILAAIATYGVTSDRPPASRPGLGWAMPYPTAPPPGDGSDVRGLPTQPEAGGWTPLA